MKITSDSNLTNGDLFTVKLTNESNVGISNKTINIDLIDSNNNVTKINITTDSQGIANFTVDADAGNYTVNATFAGDDHYASSKTSQNLTIEEVQTESSSYQSESESSGGSQSSSSNNHEDYENEIVYSTDPNSDKCVLDENGHIDQDLVDHYNKEAREKYGPIG